MREIQSLTLVLENCESIYIEKKFIGSLDIANITSNISRLGCNSIAQHLCCDRVFIEIHKNADTRCDSFGYEGKSTKFQRLCVYTDITAIEVFYEDGGTDYILVPWASADECDCNNKYQTTLLTKCGHLYLLIDKEKTIVDALQETWDLEDLGDEDVMSTYWDLLAWDCDESESPLPDCDDPEEVE